MSTKGIERQFNIPFVAELALREKQIQQNYRPVIAVHKWFARRPGTLFRALLLSEFVDGPLQETFFQSHDLKGVKVADPFMGGGTSIIEANRIGCDVIGCDINPMAYWIVRQEIEHLDLNAYQAAAFALASYLEKQVGNFYTTKCVKCKNPEAQVKYFLWVKTLPCVSCAKTFDLFPGYLLAENRRHPKHVVICSKCGWLNEVAGIKTLGRCLKCSNPLAINGPAKRNYCTCPHCEASNHYPRATNGPPNHRMYAIEYHCTYCKPRHTGRFFKRPDADDLKKYSEVIEHWRKIEPTYVPEDTIPSGDETDRLHRWGYRQYQQMFNERQLLGLELICKAIANESNGRVKSALATNLSDLLRYQNMLCRYDTYALKSLDIFSVHGFPVGLIACESNLLGIVNGKDRINIGSGGWTNIVSKFVKAKRYCEQPFEVIYKERRKYQLPIENEWIGDERRGSRTRVVHLHCDSSLQLKLSPASLDAVFTDPPYFSNVQYAELIDFCYVWLRKLLVSKEKVFGKHSTRTEEELTGNATMERGLDHFTHGLSSVFSLMATALKPGRPLTFTYHHNKIEAYYPIAVAILDAGLVCSASLPCPAEMGASIHINGTGSSIIDTVFVCRSTGRVSRKTIVSTPREIADLVKADLSQLQLAGLKPTFGDARCIAHGHLIRLTIWKLKDEWRKDIPIQEKFSVIRDVIESLGGMARIERHLPTNLSRVAGKNHSLACEKQARYRAKVDEISF